MRSNGTLLIGRRAEGGTEVRCSFELSRSAALCEALLGEGTQAQRADDTSMLMGNGKVHTDTPGAAATSQSQQPYS